MRKIAIISCSKNKKLQEQILKNNELKKNILRELKDKK